MIGPAFDVFRTELDGLVVWCAAAPSMAEAHTAIKRLALKYAGISEFMIVNAETGERTIIKPEKLHHNAA